MLVRLLALLVVAFVVWKAMVRQPRPQTPGYISQEEDVVTKPAAFSPDGTYNASVEPPPLPTEAGPGGGLGQRNGNLVGGGRGDDAGSDRPGARQVFPQNYDRSKRQ